MQQDSLREVARDHETNPDRVFWDFWEHLASFLCLAQPVVIAIKRSLLGKKVSISAGSLRASLFPSLLQLLSCLRRPGDATGFSHPFSLLMPELGSSAGVPTIVKSGFGGGWLTGLAGRPDPVYPGSARIFSWLFD